MTTTEIQTSLDEAQLLLYRDRRRAHATLFGGKRREHPTPAFHWEMVDDWHSAIRQLIQVGFGGCAKTTIGEEGTTIGAIFQEFRYCLIASSTDEIAEMRLHAIKKQFESNESILEIFGNLKSRPWETNHIELSNGVVIRAIGRGHSIRGAKDTDVRPDFIWGDDIEDLKSVANAGQIEKTIKWFDGELIGRADQSRLKMRITANDMGADSMSKKLTRPESGFVAKIYPWIKNGVSVWEERFPLAQCLRTKAEMYARGSGDEYEREFMCNSSRPEARTFNDEMKLIEPRVRTVEPCFAMFYFPKGTASNIGTTSCAVWSWIDTKLVVWELWTKRLAASELGDEVLRVEGKYHPVNIGMPEWAMSDPSATYANFVAKTKPKSEIDFVRALQPFFVGKQVSFAFDPAGVWTQFLNFPSGSTDAPLALAYSLDVDRGRVYDDFTVSNIAPELGPEKLPFMLAINADEDTIAAVLCQMGDRGLRIYADWCESGVDPIDYAPKILQQACMLAARQCQVIYPVRHFEPGRDRAIRGAHFKISMGGDVHNGRAELRKMLRSQSRGLPQVLVNSAAHWTTNAFLAGYTLTTQDDGPYALIMEALESFMGLVAIGEIGEAAGRANATSRDGRDYYSARPMKHG